MFFYALGNMFYITSKHTVHLNFLFYIYIYMYFDINRCSIRENIVLVLSYRIIIALFRRTIIVYVRKLSELRYPTKP